MEKQRGVESDRSKSSIKTNIYRSTIWNITSIKMCVGKILTGNIPHNACYRLSLVFFFYPLSLLILKINILHFNMRIINIYKSYLDML